MSLRRGTAALVAVCMALLVVPVAAGAKSAPATASAAKVVNVTSFNRIPITGTATNHSTFKGTFWVQRFVRRNGHVYALGTLSGRLGKRAVYRSQVAIPVKVPQSSSSGTATTAQATTCPILHLDLGPLDLNLLGLHVHLNEVVLDITAEAGPGNLLGNLLCDVANLLNGNGLSLGQLTGLLNILQQILNFPTLLNL